MTSQTQPLPSTAAGTPSDLRFAVDDDPLGPAAWAYALPHAEFRRVGNPGGTYYDTTDALGRTVRVRDDSRPEAVVAVVDTSLAAPASGEQGAMVVIGYGLDDAQVLQLIDVLTSDGTTIERPDPAALPANLTIVDGAQPADSIPVAAFVVTQVTLSGPDGLEANVTALNQASWQSLLNARAHQRGAVEITVGTWPGLAWSASGPTQAEAGAVFITDHHTHELWIAGVAGDAVGLDEVLSILDELEPTALTEIGEALGYPPRRPTVEDWMHETSLPASADLDWLLEGPPNEPSDLAYFVHQVFACAWFLEWADNGDPDSLAALDRQHEWPTAAVIAQQRGLASNAPLYLPGPDVPDESEIAQLDAEQRAALVTRDCGFAMS